MKLIPYFSASFALLFPLITSADNSFYCPGNHAYINLGMSISDVVSACGQPSDKQQSTQPAMVRVPVTQLIYTTLDSGAVYDGLNSTYQMWSLPSGSKGVTLQVNIMDNKVTAVNINGSSNNASTVCSGNTVQIGDLVDSVYSACGAPTTINQTYLNQAVPGKAKPEIWTYGNDPYQPPFHLTFLNGILQSID